MAMVLTSPLSGGFVDWMDAGNMWRMYDKITISKNDAAGKGVYTWNTAYETLTQPNIVNSNFNSHWRSFLHSCFDFTSYNIEWRLWAVIPERVVGKFLIRWAPFCLSATGSQTIFTTGVKDPTIEWDLARQDYIDFVTPKFKRYPRTVTRYQFVPATEQPEWGLSDALETRGVATLQVSNPLRVGSLFPDTYDLFIFCRLKDYELSGVSDFRRRPVTLGTETWINALAKQSWM
jgi:hypothetical protein